VIDTTGLLDGGPTHRLMERIGLLKLRAPELARGALVMALFGWLPLLVLAAIDGHLTRGVPVPFLFDYGVHARQLFALPLLIVAEVVLGPRLGGAAARFLERGLVKPDEVPRFEQAVAQALRIRDSAVLEIAVLVLAYVGSFLTLALAFSFQVSRWDLLITPTGPRITSAGIWNTFVAVPLYQFLVYRSLVRLFNWFGFLWTVAGLDLQLVPTHPDRSGGLGFLGGAHRPLGVLAISVGAVLSGRYCTEILQGGSSLAAIKAPIAVFVAIIVLVCLGPLVVFMPQLMAARRRGLVEYGGLAFRYVTEFDRKWLRGGAPAGEELLGSGDIQSLADMGGSFERIEQMRPVPFGLKDVTALVAACLLPMVPVLATAMPIEEVVKIVLKILG
jgi:hypothetical protein